LRWSK